MTVASSHKACVLPGTLVLASALITQVSVGSSCRAEDRLGLRRNFGDHLVSR
jgi:hypothetical protein